MVAHMRLWYYFIIIMTEQTISKYDIVKVAYYDATYVLDMDLIVQDNLVPKPVISFGILIESNENFVVIASKWRVSKEEIKNSELDIVPTFILIIPVRSIIKIKTINKKFRGILPKILESKITSLTDSTVKKILVSNKKEDLKIIEEFTYYIQVGMNITIDWNDIKLLEPTCTESNYKPTWMQIRGIFEAVVENFIFISKPDNVNMDTLAQHPQIRPQLFCIPIQLILNLNYTKESLKDSKQTKQFSNSSIPSAAEELEISRFKNLFNHRFANKKKPSVNNTLSEKYEHELIAWMDTVDSKEYINFCYGFVLNKTSEGTELAATLNASGFTEMQVIPDKKLISV